MQKRTQNAVHILDLLELGADGEVGVPQAGWLTDTGHYGPLPGEELLECLPSVVDDQAGQDGQVGEAKQGENTRGFEAFADHSSGQLVTDGTPMERRKFLVPLSQETFRLIVCQKPQMDEIIGTIRAGVILTF